VLAVPGVHDAVVFQPEAPAGAAVHRVAALVVAPGLKESDVLAGLAGTMDPVFLPRPLRLVEQLPRNEVGKLPREQLLVALRNSTARDAPAPNGPAARPRSR
jgi:acyl-coenzyme A synthetase/AMP-(fatty) acid ligase